MEAIVVMSFGMGDLLMQSPIVRELLKANYNVTLVAEAPADVFFGTTCKVLLYTRNGTKANFSSVIPLVKGKHYDMAVIGVPSNNLEGEEVLHYVSKSITVCYSFKEECLVRRKKHTLKVNSCLVNDALKSSGAPDYFSVLKESWLESGCKTREVFLHVGMKNHYWRNRAFPLAFFQKVIAWLKSHDYIPIVIGDRRQAVSAFQLTDRRFTMIGQPIERVVSRMARGTAFVGNDCGPAHLAAHLGLPTIAFFGPTNAETTGPIGPQVFNLQGKVDCGPCYWHTATFLSCDDPICHKEITMEKFIDVWNKCESFFK